MPRVSDVLAFHFGDDPFLLGNIGFVVLFDKHEFDLVGG